MNKIIRYTRIIMILCLFIFSQSLHAADNPEMVLQNGHNGRINEICITQDGKYIVTGAMDNTIKIWTIDGRLYRTIRGEDWIRGLQVLPDFSCIFASYSGTGYLIDKFSPEGKIIAQYKSTAGNINAFKSNSDGSRLVASTFQKKILVWDGTGKIILDISCEDVPGKVDITPDGKNIVYALNSELRIVSLSGSPVAAIRGHSGDVLHFEISHDGKRIISSSVDKTIRIWDMSGKLLQTINDVERTDRFALSRDGRYIARLETTNSRYQKLEILGLDKKRVNLIPMPSGTTYFDRFAFMPDSKSLIAAYLISGSAEKAYIGDAMVRYNIFSGAIETRFSSQAYSFLSAVVTPGNERMITIGSDYKMAVIHASGKPESIIGFPGRNIRRMAATRDCRYIYAVSNPEENGNTMIHRFTSDGRLIWEINDTTPVSSISSIATSEDGKYVLCGRSGQRTQVTPTYSKWENISSLALWDSEGKLLRKITISTASIGAVAISPDGEYLLAGDFDHRIHIYDNEGNLIKSFPAHNSGINGLAFLPDGRHFVSTSANENSVALWDINGNRKALLSIPHYTWFRAGDVDASPDGKYLAISAMNGKVALYHSDGKLISCVDAHADTALSVKFSPDSRYLISTSRDCTVRVFNIQKEESYRIMRGPASWLVYMDDGTWDGSNDCGSLVGMSSGMAVYGIDQFAMKNNRPDLILKRMGLGSQELIEHYYQQYQKRLRKSEMDESDLFSDLHVPVSKIIETRQNAKSITLKFELLDSEYRIIRYNIFVNDVPLYGTYGKSISGKKHRLSETIDLIAGKNKIEISCTNEKGAESYRALTFAEYKEKLKGDLYYIGFGVSKYKDNSLDLKYADKDARDLAEMYSSMKKGYKNVIVKTYLNDEVTVENIKQARDLLKNAKPDDTFVLFIAGHGMHDTDTEATYYYLTYNADRDNISGTCANFELIEDLMQGIAPRNKLFLMDTCESGEIEDAAETVFVTAADSRGIKARSARAFVVKGKGKSSKRTYLFQKDRYIYNDLVRRSGAIVFSSSKGGEFSYESDKIQNGFFTKEIISAIKKMSADKNGDGTVTTDELRDYVSHNVEKATGGLQHPTVDRDNLYQKFGFSGK